MKRLENYIYSFLFLGILISGFELTIVSTIGKLCMLTYIGICLLIFLKVHSYSKVQFQYYIPLFIIQLIYAYNLVVGYKNFLDIYICIQFCLIIILIMTIINKPIHFTVNKNLYRIIVIIVAINLLYLIFTNSLSLSPNRTSSLFIHKNTFATTMFYLICLLLIVSNHIKMNRYFMLFLIISMLYMIYLSNSRAIYAALILFSITYIFWEIICEHLLIRHFVILSVFFLGFLFILILSGNIPGFLPASTELNDLFLIYTGGNLNSGRQLLWPTIVEEILKKPWLGHSPGHMPNRFMDTEWSSHNFYLQLVLQVGFIGLGFFLIFIQKIWHTLTRYKNDNDIRIVGSLLIAILFQQMFAVSLTQNNMEQALLFWMIIGFGLNKAIKNDKKLSRLSILRI